MISNLNIKNFSIVKDINIDFHAGLNVIHGESGAGKSLILNALGILCGRKASPQLIREGEDKAIISMELDQVGLIQKIISKNKSIQSIDGEFVTVEELKSKIGDRIENFSQGEQEEIYTQDYQLTFVNQFCEDQVLKVRSAFTRWSEQFKLIESKKSNLSSIKEKAEFYNFQIEELTHLDLKSDEDLLLEELINAETNKDKIVSALSEISETTDSMKSQFEIIEKRVQTLSKLSVEFKVENIEGLRQFLTDWQNEVAQKSFDVEEYMGTQTLDELNSRAYELQKIKKKLGKSSINEVIEYRDKILLELQTLETFDEDLSKEEEILKSLTTKYLDESKSLHETQDIIIRNVSYSITPVLLDLGFTYVDLTVAWKELKTFSPNGIKQFEFLVSFNQGFEPQLLKKIVSGGEASRLALAMKLLSKSEGILILDEIDTGLSGNSVASMAKVLKSMESQIICVTHSPNIIDAADKKIEVYKEVIDGRTNSRIRF